MFVADKSWTYIFAKKTTYERTPNIPSFGTQYALVPRDVIVE